MGLVSVILLSVFNGSRSLGVDNYLSSNKSLQKSRFGYLYVLAAGVSFGSTSVLSTFLRDMGVPSIEQGFFRIALTALFFGSILVFKPTTRKVRRADVKFFVVNGLFGVSLSIIAYLSSIALGTPVAIAVTLSYLQPMFSVVLAWILLREQVTIIRLAAVAVSIFGASIVSGVWQIFGTPTAINGVGVVLASLNGFFYATYLVLGRLSGSARNYHFATTMFYSFLFALIWITPLWLLVGSLISDQIVSGFVIPSSEGLVLLFAIGIIGTIVPYGLLSLGLRYVGASKAGILLLIEPISVMILGVVILNQPLTPWGILGAGLVLSATLLIGVEARSARKRSKKLKD